MTKIIIIWWNPALAPAPAWFALQIRQNLAPAGFPKSKYGTALVHCEYVLCMMRAWCVLHTEQN